MKKYRLLNNSLGWFSFLIAAIVYLLTIEPTASLWDCGEFIASAYKLEVGHPPGAPFFMILARFFSLFAGDNTAIVPKMINSLSALMSAGTILFLFWTITYFAKKLIGKSVEELSTANIVAIMGSGLVGALAYTFSDTFWFSAVEGEVYASSSFFTAITFWAILKWESVADEKYSGKWLILIAYLMGLSIGVHLLNLLAIPAIVFVLYFKKYKVTYKGIAGASAISILVLAIVMYGIIPGIITMASKFELLFVNDFGMPFNTGVVVFIVLLFASVIFGLYLTYKKSQNILLIATSFTLAVFLVGVTLLAQKMWAAIFLAIIVFFVVYYLLKKHHALLNTILLAFSVIVIGYSSFTMIVIRASADPPMDENNPDNVFSLLAYLNREQYGDRPLMKGLWYNIPYQVSPLDHKNGEPQYIQDKKTNKYKIIGYKPIYTYQEDLYGFFPRMWSTRDQDRSAYEANYKGRTVYLKDKNGNNLRDKNGKKRKIKVPKFSENIKFMMAYQINHMYFRYFMWNFAGRQNDIQGYSDNALRGNWLSGIKFIDEARLGPQDNIPERFKNDARNVYFMLPLLLGLFGLVYQLTKKSKDFVIVALLFFFTGIAIVLYLNQNPFQPRERDYAYAGSFYAFAIWIGLGVISLYDALKDKIKGVALPGALTTVCLVLVPGIMAKENWDDHDRSDRYTAKAYARNYLETCAPNAILFTNGDNDTFPLWYAQEVEGIRTDVRVCNLMLFNTDWYIDQMKRKAYGSEALPISFTKDQYVQGTNDQVRIENWINKPMRVGQAVDYMLDRNNSRTRFLKQKNAQQVFSSFMQKKYGEHMRYYYENVHLPTNKFVVGVDKEKVLNNGTVATKDSALIVPNIQWQLKKGTLTKSEIMQIDMLANFNWDRPIYWVNLGGGTLNMEEYFQHEGLAYRLVPIKTPQSGGNVGRVDVDILYDNLMNKYTWGGLNDPNVHLDQFNIHTLRVIRLRYNYTRLANLLTEQNKLDSAVNVLDYCVKLMPHSKVPYDQFVPYMAAAYYNAEAINKGDSLITEFKDIIESEMEWFMKFPENKYSEVAPYIEENIRFLNTMKSITEPYNKELSEELNTMFQDYYQEYAPKVEGRR